LKAALRWSVRNGTIDAVPYIEMPPATPPRSLALTKDQYKALLAEAKGPYPHLYDFLRISLLTGQRQAAVLGLTWDRVDLDRGYVDFRDPKKGSRAKGAAYLPIGDELRAVFEEIRARTDGSPVWVVTYKGLRIAHVRRSWKKVTDKLGIDGACRHTLRHTVATQLIENGVSLQKVSRLLGHASVRTTERNYVKYSPEYVRDAVDGISLG